MPSTLYMPTNEPPEPAKGRSNPFRGVNAGYLPAAGALLGFGGGWLIDRSAGTLPWWTLGLGVVMTAASFYHMFKEFSR